jgi:hypothetical protein
MKLARCLPFALVCLASASAAAALLPPSPAPPVVPVTEDYFGTSITDNYRYMEEAGNPVSAIGCGPRAVTPARCWIPALRALRALR